MKPQIKTRYVHKDYTHKMERTDINAVVHWGDFERIDGTIRIGAIAYSGKRTNHDWHYIFHNEAQLMQHVEQYFATLQSNKKFKEERLRERKQKEQEAISEYNVGDILVCSWGYDQTNVDFYEIVKKKNRTIVIEEIGASHVKGSGGFMSEQVIANPKLRTGIFKTKRIGAYGISMTSYSSAFKWNGEPKYHSWYA